MSIERINNIFSNWQVIGSLLFVLFYPQFAYAQNSADDFIKESERALQESQNRLRKMQDDLDRMQRIDNESRRREKDDIIRYENLIRQLNDKRLAEEAEVARQNVIAEQKREAEKAEEALEEQRMEMELQRAQVSNQLYVFVLAISVLASSIFLVKKRRGGYMFGYQEKFGIIVGLVSLLLIFLAFAMSDGWNVRLDLLQNLMLNLKLRLIEIGYDRYELEVPTRYVCFVLGCSATYGLTSYLGVTPALNIRKFFSKLIGDS